MVVSGTEVKIAEDGEILVRGPHVFQGYFNDQAATDDTLIDGWLHSGDLGEFTDEGFLKITGRRRRSSLRQAARTSLRRISKLPLKTARSSRKRSLSVTAGNFYRP